MYLKQATKVPVNGRQCDPNALLHPFLRFQSDYFLKNSKIQKGNQVRLSYSSECRYVVILLSGGILLSQPSNRIIALALLTGASTIIPNLAANAQTPNLISPQLGVEAPKREAPLTTMSATMKVSQPKSPALKPVMKPGMNLVQTGSNWEVIELTANLRNRY